MNASERINVQTFFLRFNAVQWEKCVSILFSFAAESILFRQLHNEQFLLLMILVAGHGFSLSSSSLALSLSPLYASRSSIISDSLNIVQQFTIGTTTLFSSLPYSIIALVFLLHLLNIMLHKNI